MRPVTAPEGYEGTVYYVDSSRSWQPAFREVGSAFWTNTFRDAGHAHLTEDEVTRRAESAIAHAIGVRFSGQHGPA